MTKKLTFFVLAIVSWPAFAVNICVPPEQLVFRWETRQIWTCDVRVETYTYDLTYCHYNGWLSRGAIPPGREVFGYLPLTKYVTSTSILSGNQSCSSISSENQTESYSYTDNNGNPGIGFVSYSGVLSLFNREVVPTTGEREVEENCRWEDKLVKVSYCEDLR